MSAEMITAIGALIVGIASVVSAIMLNRKTMALLEYRMGRVEKKLDSHNGYAKMFTETSKQIAEIQKDVAVIKTRLEYIEEAK
jgi:hypothetical protein